MKPPRSPPEILVGRGWEQRVLRECLHAASAGRGGLTLIGGEAGIGKTALVDWLADEAQEQNLAVLTGRCDDLLLTSPYGPWREALARGGSAGEIDTGNPLRSGEDFSQIGDQAALFARVHEHLVIRADRNPVLLVLEDLHWADPASLELLRFIARDLTAMGLLLTATYRADELTRQHPLFPVLPHLVREAKATRIDLAPLTEGDVRDLLTARYALPPDDETRLTTFLHARSGGNPFYLTEMARALEADRLLRQANDGWQVGDLDQAGVPPLVRQIIETRLTRLDEETQRLLEIAAVIGEKPPLATWQAVSEAGGDRLALAIEQAAAAHLIHDDRSPLTARFSHALVRETLYLRQPLSQRRATHRMTAEVLAALPDPPLSDLASHFAAADDSRAIIWLVRAGNQALSLYAAQDAVAAFTRAHDLAGRFAHPLSPEAYRSRATAYALLGEFDSARRDHELVLERARRDGDRRAGVAFARRLGPPLGRAGLRADRELLPRRARAGPRHRR